MKKLVVLLSVCVLIALCGACGKKEAGPKVRVTVSTAGTVQLAAKETAVKDLDGDGVLSVWEAVQCAHDAYAPKDKAFVVEDTEYGKSITSVWGDVNGLSAYGTYQNNAMVYDLTAPIAEGDYVVVYSYADLTAWTDCYAFFEPLTAAEGKVTLTASYSGFDENWNPVLAPLADAVITIDGADTEYVTDADGKVTVEISKKGEAVVSARSDTLTLVPPVALITVK